MKELFKQIYLKGIKRYDHYVTQEDHRSFEQWYESNKHLIDSAITNYIVSQDHQIVSNETMKAWINEVKSANETIVRLTKLLQSI